MNIQQQIRQNQLLLRANFDLQAKCQRLEQSLINIHNKINPHRPYLAQTFELQDVVQTERAIVKSLDKLLLQFSKPEKEYESVRFEQLYRQELQQNKKLSQDVRRLQRGLMQLKDQFKRKEEQLELTRNKLIEVFRNLHLKIIANRIDDHIYINSLANEQNQPEETTRSNKKSRHSPSPAKQTKLKDPIKEGLQRMVERGKEQLEDYKQQIEVMCQMKESMWEQLRKQRERNAQLSKELQVQRGINRVVRKSRLQQLQYLMSKE